MTSSKWTEHRRRKRRREHARSAKAVLSTVRGFSGEGVEPRVIAYLRKIRPIVFEELLLQAFKQQGYLVQRKKRHGGDGGIDGRIIDADGGLILLQAKRVKSAINPDDVARLSSLVRGAKARLGIFAHTGRTGPASYRERKGKVVFLSGQRLVRFLTEHDPDASWFVPVPARDNAAESEQGGQNEQVPF